MTTAQPDPDIVVVPTEMSRADGFFDLAFLVGTGLVAWWFALRGAPLWLFAPVLLCLSVFVLTGEPAGDVPFVGALAAGLRSKLGLRRAHEWCLAFIHYFRVRLWPDFQQWSRTKWERSRLNSKIAMLTRSAGWQRITSGLRNNRLRHLSIRSWRSTKPRPISPSSVVDLGQ